MRFEIRQFVVDGDLIGSHSVSLQSHSRISSQKSCNLFLSGKQTPDEISQGIEISDNRIANLSGDVYAVLSM